MVVSDLDTCCADTEIKNVNTYFVYYFWRHFFSRNKLTAYVK